ncbi:MAG: hypothetical protein JWM96_901, partial [Alphaproteobacteria bacterium]|nr:hypothetical protein [Alphaproteobacteria bacterium]
MAKPEEKPRFSSLNERAKYKYRKHIQHVGRKDKKTVIEALKHLRYFEAFIQFAGFETFNKDIASRYVQDLFHRTKSVSFVTTNLKAVRDFLNWLERQRGYRTKI